MIKIFLVIIHEPVMPPRFRDQHHDSKWQVKPVHIEELQRIVEHGRIRSAPLNDRKYLCRLLIKER